MKPRWRKVLRDLWINKTRTLLVILSIAVGVFSVGMITHLRVVVGYNMEQSYINTRPAQATIYTSNQFDQTFVAAVRRMPDISAAEGRRKITVQFRVGDDPAWYPLDLIALQNPQQPTVNIVAPEQVFKPDPASWPNPGVWPPPNRAIVLERTSLLVANLGLLRTRLNDEIHIKLPSGKERDIPLAGLAYDFSQTPASNTGRAFGFITMDTLEWLGEARTLNQLDFRVNGDANNSTHIAAVARLVSDKADRADLRVSRVYTYPPGQLPLENQFQAIQVILGTLAVLSLIMSAFLVANTISALILQQTGHIGVMKTLGARREQIAQLYIVMVLFYSLIAIAIAIPLGSITAFIAIELLTYFINFNQYSITLPREVVVFEIAIGLLVPILAALAPILRGTALTVREAIAIGAGGSAALQSGVAQHLLWLNGLPTSWLLAVRNTFRQPIRLLLTMLTLILGSALFVGVLSVRQSLYATLESALQYRRFDVQIQFSRLYRTDALANEALRVSGVTHVEGWGSLNTVRVRPDTTESDSVSLNGVPATTQLLQPTLINGRWLVDSDQNALVISSQFAQAEPDVQVGSTISLRIHDKEQPWQVVGIFKAAGSSNLAYVNQTYLAQVDGSVGRVRSIVLTTSEHTASTQDAVAKALQAHFTAEGINVSTIQTGAAIRASNETFFGIIVTLLMIMATLLTCVGGIGLMGMMSINVLERIHEIGVMRTIGATDQRIVGLVIGEGICVSLLSWLLGVLLAYPVGMFLCNEVGRRFLNTTLTYEFSWQGCGIWLGLIVVIATVATWLPAQRAANMRVAAALAYE